MQFGKLLIERVPQPNVLLTRKTGEARAMVPNRLGYPLQRFRQFE